VEKSFSFPSGHAAIAIALYGFLSYVLTRNVISWKLRTNVVFAALIVAFTVGLSRMYLGLHFLSDVLGGYVIGLLWLMVGATLAEILRSRSTPAGLSSRLLGARTPLTIILIAALAAFYAAFAVNYAPPGAVASFSETNTPG